MSSIFMQLPGIKGEAKDQAHEGWVELENVSWSHSRTIAPGAKSNQRARGETHFNEITVTAMMTKVSMQVQQNAALGKILDPVEIHFCRATGVDGKALEAYLTIKLSDCLIVNYTTSITGEHVPHESYALDFTKVEMQYKESDSKSKQTSVAAFTYDKEKASAA